MEGFIVVQKSLTQHEARYNPGYRGVDRLVLWTMENFQKGFDDPYLSPIYATNEGFIQNLSLAREVLQIFTQIVAPDDLEILWIRESTGDGEVGPLADPGVRFLGFDAAGNGSPFFSIILDLSLSPETVLRDYTNHLNENGLFISAEWARSYLETCLNEYPEYRDEGIVVWEVYLVEEDALH